jgi:hypothetical protein
MMRVRHVRHQETFSKMAIDRILRNWNGVISFELYQEKWLSITAGSARKTTCSPQASTDAARFVS